MRRLAVFSFICCAFACPAAQGAIFIDIGSATLAPGGGGSVDVLISSDAGDQLGLFNFEFQIVRETGSGQLDFADPQAGAQLTDSSYVFNIGTPNSYDALTNFGLVGNVVSSTTFTGGDLTNDFTNVSVPSTQLLLAKLDFISDPSASTQSGDVFRIELSSDANYTLFSDIDANAIAFSSSPGHVTIAGASTVPEPGTLGMLLTGTLGLLYARRRQARRRF